MLWILKSNINWLLTVFEPHWFRNSFTEYHINKRHKANCQKTIQNLFERILNWKSIFQTQVKVSYQFVVHVLILLLKLNWPIELAKQYILLHCLWVQWHHKCILVHITNHFICASEISSLSIIGIINKSENHTFPILSCTNFFL